MRSAMRGSCEQGLAAVIPGWSGGPDPESRDSGFDASHRPGMTVSELPGRFAPRKTVISREESEGYSTLQLCDSIIGASEYWIARFRGRRRLRVLARSRPSLRAKRSNPFFLSGFMDFFASLAMTKNPDVRSSSRREASEALLDLPPKEGVGNAGCPMHPRPRVHLVAVERTRVYEYTGITRHSRTQWF